MFAGHLQPILAEELAYSPAVALLGPRQSGKTTLAMEVARNRPHVYLDLESERDRAKLAQAELHFEAQRDGLANGRYLILGSASLDVLKQSGETLAGRVAFLELGPLHIGETGPDRLDDLWVCGGFPPSLTAPSDARSLRWRESFIRTYLESDILQFGPPIAAETLRRFWTMLAHHQGGLLNMAQLARNLGVDVKTVANYVDLLCDLLLVRRLQPWHVNSGKRLIKAPKVYVRNSGLLHALLGVETLLACAPAGVPGHFYRTSAGAEVDLLLAEPGGDLWAIEIKRSLSPKLERGFHAACADLKPARKGVVYPGMEALTLAPGVQPVPLAVAQKALAAGLSGRQV